MLASTFSRKSASDGKLKRPAALNKINQHTPTSKSSTYDLIGPPDKISNLRQFRAHVPKDESKLECDYRALRERVFEFNNDYWTQQNLKFVDAKRQYAQQCQVRQNYLNQMNYRKVSEASSAADSSDLQMNEFYKQFLNENYYNHYEYNKTWLKLNFQLLWMAFRVNLYRFLKCYKLLKTK